MSDKTLKICFDSKNPTLYIGDIPADQYNNNCSFMTSTENVCNLDKLYEHLGCNEAKKVGIERDKILEFMDSEDRRVFKVKVVLNIPIYSDFIWDNATFLKVIEIDFNIDTQMETNIILKQSIFNENIKLKISNQHKSSKIDLSNNVFKGKFELLWLETKETIFNESKFLRESHFSIHNKTNEFQNMSFKNCVFGEKDFGKTINFKNCIFTEEVDFSNCKFYTDVYFNNSHFKDSADFHECEFEKTACFYGATFDETPNFSQAIFKENLNMVNTNLNFNFDDLNVKIEQEYEYFNKNKREENKKSLDKFANDFRDSFRLIKSALIKDNNLLDASNFHKYELYCKEIELEQIWHRQGKSAETEVDTRRNTQKFRDYIECLLLGFYRKLCDHHTDF